MNDANLVSYLQAFMFCYQYIVVMDHPFQLIISGIFLGVFLALKLVDRLMPAKPLLFLCVIKFLAAYPLANQQS